MSALWNKTRNRKVFDQLAVADDPAKRMRGLLGRDSLPDNEGLLIKGDAIMPANFIHTFFMRFTIDLIFIDRDSNVVAVKENVKPWRVCLPVWRAHSVIEGNGGTVNKVGIAVGDKLDVVT